MSEYRIFETDEFAKKLKKLPSREAAFLRKKLDGYVYPQIKQEPFWGSNIKKLQGYTPQTWRYRMGKFRLFYMIDLEEQVVFILTVDHRKDAYGR